MQCKLWSLLLSKQHKKDAKEDLIGVFIDTLKSQPLHKQQENGKCSAVPCVLNFHEKFTLDKLCVYVLCVCVCVFLFLHVWNQRCIN